jgi:secondary thiamine-phosphate synthase enzyme
MRKMDIFTEIYSIQTKKETELINITAKIENFVKKHGIKEGLINIYTMHTTSAILINENEEGLEEDIPDFLERLVPKNWNYRHSHFYRKDGRMAINAWAHIRSVLIGPNASLPIKNGKLLKGFRQNIYFIELDGPHKRDIVMQAFGAKK